MMEDIRKTVAQEVERQNKRDTYYLTIAEAVAGKSTCLRRHYGAVIVNEDEIVSTGYNGSPRGCPNCTDMGCMRQIIGTGKGDAYNLCASVHAEQNAIISASRREMLGSSLYIVGLNHDPYLQGRYADPTPCLLCHRMIINAGIRRVVGMMPSDENGHGGIAKTLNMSPAEFLKRMIDQYEKVANQLIDQMLDDVSFLDSSLDHETRAQAIKDHNKATGENHFDDLMIQYLNVLEMIDRVTDSIRQKAIYPLP